MILLTCVSIALMLVCLLCMCLSSLSCDKELEKLDTMIAESHAIIERANRRIERSK